jgi:hypothetical protein
VSRRLLATALSLLAVGSFAAEGAAANPPAPIGLQVEDGEGWHPTNLFNLEWTIPEPEGSALAAVRYRFRDSTGTFVGSEVRIEGVVSRLNGLRAPGLSGAYTIEVWFEDSGGEEGPPATAWLRYDNATPADASVRPVEGWIGRNSFPFTIRIEPPEGAPPISGLRGYAVSVDDVPLGEPCAGSIVCTDSETNHPGGAGDLLHTIPELPEGTHHVHVLAVSGSRRRSRYAAHTPLLVDKTYPTTTISGVPPGWTNRAVVLTVTATDTGSGMTDGAPGDPPFTAIRVGERVPVLTPGDRAQAILAESGEHRIAHYARDAAGNVADGGTTNGRPNPSPATALVRIDRDPPSVHFRSWQDPDDPELIEARVADALAGPSRSRGSIQIRRAGSNEPYQALPTEVDGGRLLARWNSAAYARGEYELRAVAHDAAGNSTITSRRSDGGAMLLPSPLTSPTILRAGLRWREPGRRVFAAGRRVRFGGRLTSASGTPLEGARVQVVERFAEGSHTEDRVSSARTREDGTFTVRLKAGPSREVAARFPGTGSLARSAAPPVRVGVRAEVRLRVSAATATIGGRPVVFRGRVVASRGEVPKEGKSVSLQFRLPGLGWADFRTLRTDRLGRFRYAYRFADDDSRGVRFQFRAHSPAQANWPYEPGSSRPVGVRGK